MWGAWGHIGVFVLCEEAYVLARWSFESVDCKAVRVGLPKGLVSPLGAESHHSFRQWGQQAPECQELAAVRAHRQVPETAGWRGNGFLPWELPLPLVRPRPSSFARPAQSSPSQFPGLSLLRGTHQSAQ